MNARSSVASNARHAGCQPITDVVAQQPIRRQYVFPNLIPKGELTIVSMNPGVDGAPFASVCAIKASSGGILPMFGNGSGLQVTLFMGGSDQDADADNQAFQQVLLDEEGVNGSPEQWTNKMFVQKQGGNEWDAVYLDTPIGYSVMKKRFQPGSLAIIYDLDEWLELGGLTVETASKLLSRLRKECIESDVTLLIFERDSVGKHTLAAEIADTSEVLQLVPDKKSPTATGAGCCLLRKRRGYFDTAPRACSFWISLTDAGTLTWGIEPSEGPQLAQKELDAVQRRILTAQWITGERTPRQIAELLGKDPKDVPNTGTQQDLARVLGVHPATTSRDCKTIEKNGLARNA